MYSGCPVQTVLDIIAVAKNLLVAAETALPVPQAHDENAPREASNNVPPDHAVQAAPVSGEGAGARDSMPQDANCGSEGGEAGFSTHGSSSSLQLVGMFAAFRQVSASDGPSTPVNTQPQPAVSAHVEASPDSRPPLICPPAGEPTNSPVDRVLGLVAHVVCSCTNTVQVLLASCQTHPGVTLKEAKTLKAVAQLLSRYAYILQQLCKKLHQHKSRFDPGKP